MTLEPFPEGWRKATVIVAHPDDIEWGVAGAVAAWTAAGHQASYVLVTSGEAGIDTMSPADAKVAREAEERTTPLPKTGAVPSTVWLPLPLTG